MSTKTVAHEGSDYVVLCDVLYDVADRVHWVGVALNYQPLEDRFAAILSSAFRFEASFFR